MKEHMEARKVALFEGKRIRKVLHKGEWWFSVIEDPELSMGRMKQLYEKKGYPKDWIDKRMRGMAVRQDLTDEWQNRGAATSLEYAILTNEIMQGAFSALMGDMVNQAIEKERPAANFINLRY